MTNALAKEGVDPNATASAWNDLQKLNSQYGELALDASLAAGGALPPPFGTAADIASLGKSVFTGDWGGALFDIIGFVPVLGDAAKGGKIANKLNDLRKALDTANSAIAKRFQKTKEILGRYRQEKSQSLRRSYKELQKQTMS